MSVPGSAPRRARIIAALVSAAIAASALLAGSSAAVAASTAAGSEAGHSSRAAADAFVSASLTAANGGLLAPGQDLVASIGVSNQSDSVIVSGMVSLWLDAKPQGSRNALSSWLTSTDDVSDPVMLGEVPLPTLEPGSSSVVTVAVPAAALPFAARASSAVYGIGTTVKSGQRTSDSRGSIVWSVGDAATRSDVGVVMPIVSPATGNGLISAEDLTTYTAANGVLTRDLDGVTGHSTVTLGIDPMIIASIRALGNAAPATARDWLTRLNSLPNDTFSLGYGDADIAGQIQSGLAAPLEPIALGYALDAKNFSPTPSAIGEPTTATARTVPSPSPTPGAGPVLPTLDELLAWKYTLPGVGWPGDKTLRGADVAPLASAGFKTLIVSGSNTNATELESTPSAALHSADSTLTVSDQRLSDALRQAVTAPSDLAWNTAMSQVNAQLQLLSVEGTTARNILVALDRSWPSSGTQLQRTLDSLFGTPWSTPASFTAVASAAPTSDLALVDAPEPSSRIDAIRGLLDDETKLTAFSSILVDPTTLTGRTRAQLLTLLAVSWQNPRTDWSTAISKSHEATTKTLHSVRILPTENVNLVSAQASIPFTVSNELPNETATVVLDASPSNGRLEIDGPTTKSVPKDSRATMLVPVKAKVGNGQVVLSLQLYSPTGVAIGDPSAVTVDVHADWEGIGAVIFVVLLVLLFGFGVVRGILRRRAQRKAEADEATSPEEGTADVSTPQETTLSDDPTPGSNTPGGSTTPGG